METTPLETFISPRKQVEDERILNHKLFEEIMRRVDYGYEKMSVVQQVLCETDVVDKDFIYKWITRNPLSHLADIGYPQGSDPSPENDTARVLVESSAA